MEPGERRRVTTRDSYRKAVVVRDNLAGVLRATGMTREYGVSVTPIPLDEKRTTFGIWVKRYDD